MPLYHCLFKYFTACLVVVKFNIYCILDMFVARQFPQISNDYFTVVFALFHLFLLCISLFMLMV